MILLAFLVILKICFVYSQEIICPGDGVKHPSRFECDGTSNICPPQWSCYENVACCISLTVLKNPVQIQNNIDEDRRPSTIAQSEFNNEVKETTKSSNEIPTKATSESALAEISSTSSSSTDATTLETKILPKENRINALALARKQIHASKRTNTVSNQRPQVEDSIDGATSNLGAQAVGGIWSAVKDGPEWSPIAPTPPDFALAAKSFFSIDSTPYPVPLPENQPPPPNPTYGFISSAVTKSQLTQYIGSKFSFENR